MSTDRVSLLGYPWCVENCCSHKVGLQLSPLPSPRCPPQPAGWHAALMHVGTLALEERREDGLCVQCHPWLLH